MKPLEINKKIAEIKGCIVLTSPKNVTINQAEKIHEGGDCNVRKYNDAKIPNWAENISDAWELFEEMDGQIVVQDRYNGAFSGGKWLCTYEIIEPEKLLLEGPHSDDMDAKLFWNNPEFCVAADTASLAICKAWLAWKESKKMNFYWKNEKVSEEEFLKRSEQEKHIPIKGTCLWHQRWGQIYTWDSGCGNELMLSTETPHAAGFRFCPFCAKELV